MKNIYAFNEFNEAKINIVNKSELFDNWSADFNVSKEIKKVISEIDKIGRGGAIDKVILIISKLGEKDYNIAKTYAKKEYNVRLPEYKYAKTNEYWGSHWATISNIIVVLASLKKSMEKTEENIKNEIENLKLRLKNIKELKN